MDRQDAERVAERAAEALGPEAGLVASLDPVSLAKALAGVRYAAGLAATGAVSAARMLGAETSPPIPPPARDRRFADTAWDGNPLFFGLQQGYLLTARLARELVAAAELPPHWHGKAELATQLLIDAMAPSNFLATNPAALKRAFDTGGRSAAKGLNNFLDDLSATAASRARSTPPRSPWARTWPPPRARWCSATPSWSCSSTRRRPVPPTR